MPYILSGPLAGFWTDESGEILALKICCPSVPRSAPLENVEAVAVYKLTPQGYVIDSISELIE